MRWLFILLFALATSSSHVWASGEDAPDPHEIAVKAQEKFLCHSTDEYIKTMKFLRETKELQFTENVSRLVAEKVAKGCDGAAGRFKQVLMTLRGVGLSDRRSLAIALDFAAQSPDIQKNFVEIFNRAYLAEFFDYEYPVAANLAIELSKDYKGEPAQVREDFIELVKYCKDGKTLDLPTKLCGELTVKMAKLSQYHPEGVRKQFYRLYKELRERKEFQLDMKSALDITYNVLKGGPRAPDNFFSAFEYATKKEGLDLDKHSALAFALKMADRSYVGDSPPPILAAEPTPGPGHAPAH